MCLSEVPHTFVLACYCKSSMTCGAPTWTRWQENAIAGAGSAKAEARAAEWSAWPLLGILSDLKKPS